MILTTNLDGKVFHRIANFYSLPTEAPLEDIVRLITILKVDNVESYKEWVLEWKTCQKHADIQIKKFKNFYTHRGTKHIPFESLYKDVLYTDFLSDIQSVHKQYQNYSTALNNLRKISKRLTRLYMSENPKPTAPEIYQELASLLSQVNIRNQIPPCSTFV